MTCPYIIGIAGPSCAGKSFLSHRIAPELGATVLHIDAYYRELANFTVEQRARFNFDAPESIETELFFDHVRQLASGRAIDRPVYNFTTHTREPHTLRIQPGEYLIIEGLFALYWTELLELEGTKVYVDLREKLCLERRKYRDVRERGRTEESVLRQFHETVQPMAQRYVYPTRDNADVVVTGNDDINHEAAQVLEHVRAGIQRQLLTTSS